MPDNPLCRYRGALGEPGKGVHAPRVFGLAAVDLLATAFAAWLLSRRKGGAVAFLVVFAFLLIVAVAVHRAFCVQTRLNTALGIRSPARDDKSAPTAFG